MRPANPGGASLDSRGSRPKSNCYIVSLSMQSKKTPRGRRGSGPRVEVTIAQGLEKTPGQNAGTAQEPDLDLQAILAETSKTGLKRIHARIKRDIKTLTPFHFLRTDFLKVRSFGQHSHVLETRLLPPAIRMGSQLIDFLSIRISPLAEVISLRLAPVVETGWLRLPPKHYNTLALLKGLADRLAKFDFTRLDPHNHAAIDKLRPIESLFLLLHRDPNTFQTISAALARSKDKETIGLVLQLIAEDCMVPSLHDCIVGLNMLKHRRYLKLQDLIRDDIGEVFDIGRFLFDTRVRRRVDAVVHGAKESVKIMRTRLAESRRVSEYIPPEGIGSSALQGMYDSVFPRPDSSFASDLQNLVAFTVRLLKSFDVLYGPLLNGHVTVERDGGMGQIRSTLFSKDFARLKHILDRLETGFSQSSRLPLIRYLRIKQGILQAIGDENETSELIGEATSCLVELGRSVASTLRSPPSEADSTEEFSLPLMAARIRSKSLLGGLTVQEALTQAVTVCFSAGVLLDDTILTMLLTREKKLQTQIQNRLGFLEKVLDPETYQEMTAT